MYGDPCTKHGCAARLRTLIPAYSVPPAPPKVALTNRSPRMHLGGSCTPVASSVWMKGSRVLASTIEPTQGSVRTGAATVAVGTAGRGRRGATVASVVL